MPIIIGRHNHVKVFRPAGTRFAEGTSAHSGLRGGVEALQAAVQAFAEEFGRPPDMRRVVAETVFTGNGVVGVCTTLFELPEEA